MASFKKGDKVTCSAEYEYTNKIHLASFVRKDTFDVIQVGGKNLPDDRIVIGKGSTVIAAVKANTLTLINSNNKKPTPKAPAAPVKSTTEEPKYNLNGLLASANNPSKYFTVAASEGGVKTFNGAKQSTSRNEKTTNVVVPRDDDLSNLFAKDIKRINRNDPSLIQNDQKFPKSLGKKNGRYYYDYSMDYDSDTVKNSNGKKETINKSLNIVHRSVNLPEINITRAGIQKRYTNYYNKFKSESGFDQLSKSFAHVFFVRPDCNIYQYSNSRKTLSKNLQQLPEFYYALKHCPEVLRQLTQIGSGYDHDFSMLLSNKARTFEIQDEAIDTDKYGQGLTGYSIPYGKDNVASRAAGEFSVSYIDDRDLRIYQMHKLWIDYISYVFRGKVSPRDAYIINKIIDYATCVYYIVCAEDGETIIFWSKYWGVFPKEAPSSSFSYSQEERMKMPELKIAYQYAWKEDFNPLSLVEFNMHSNTNNLDYVENYQDFKLGPSSTWAGAPFIETVGGTGSSTVLPYTLKLRFRKGIGNLEE